MCSNSEVTEQGEWGWEGVVEVWEDFLAGHHDCLDSVSPSGKRTSMTHAVGPLKFPVTSADKAVPHPGREWTVCCAQSLTVTRVPSEEFMPLPGRGGHLVWMD